MLFVADRGVAQCGLESPVNFRDARANFTYIRVNNASNDDLSSPSQGICQIDLKFRHEVVGDIDLILVSPLGRNYPLIQKGGSRSTDGTVWDISFVPCSQEAKPDQGGFIKPEWDSDQPWGQNQIYNGTYHPETCLSTIDIGPVNGIWTIIMRDNTATGTGRLDEFEITFCDDGGIECDVCEVYGGVTPRDTIKACGGQARLSEIAFEPNFGSRPPDPAIFDFLYVVVNDGRIFQISEAPDLTSATKGDYLVFGLTIDRQDRDTIFSYLGGPSSTLFNKLNVARLNHCGALASGVKVYSILSDPDPLVVVEEYICEGTMLMFNGQEITAPGLYTAHLISSVGCDSIVELRVKSFVLDRGITNPGIIGCGNKPLTLSWQNRQFEDEPSYRWFTRDGSILAGDRTPNASIDLPGTYWLVVGQNGCFDTVSTSVLDDGTMPTLLVDDVVMDCHANVANISPNTNAIGFQWTGPFGFTSTDRDIVISEPGDYTLLARGVNCSVRKTISVSADFVRPLDVAASGALIRCSGDSVQIHANSTTQDVEYRWEGPNGFTATEANPWVSSEGRYTVFVGNPDNGCAEVRDVNVQTLITKPSITLTGAVLDCQNLRKPILTTVDDPFATFTWTGPAGFFSESKNPVVDMPGKYNVQIIDENQCVYYDSVSVIVDTIKPTVNAADVFLNCTQAIFQLSAGYTSVHPPEFRWSGPGGFLSTTLDTSGTQAGRYNIRVRDPVNGCAVSQVIEVFTDPRQPVITATNKVINCERSVDTLIVTSQCVGGCTVLWEGPGNFSSTEDTVETDVLGSYTVMVTDTTNNCSSLASVNVVNRATPYVRNVNNVPVGCTTDGRLTLARPDLFREILWRDLNNDQISTSPRMLLDVPTSVELVTTDTRGCVESDTFEVGLAEDQPQVDIIANQFDCQRDRVTLDVDLQPYSKGAIASYLWTLPDGSTSSEANPRAAQAGDVSVRLTLSNGCQGVGVGILTTDYEEPQAIAMGGGFRCRDAGRELGLDVDRPPLATHWSGPNGFESFDETPLVAVPGMYTLLVVGANGCETRDTAEVYYSDVLPAVEAFGDTVTCLDTAANVVFVTNAAAGFQFEWIDPGGRVNGNREIITTLPGTYTLMLTDTNQCRVITQAFVQVDTVTFGHEIRSTLVSCRVDSSFLLLDTVYPHLDYRWEFDSMIVSRVHEPLVRNGGLYTLITTNTNGCERVISHQVEADTVSPYFELRDFELNCRTRRFNILPIPINGQWDYSWSGPGDFSSTHIRPLITAAGVYQLTNTAKNGCTHTATSTVTASFETPEIIVDSTFIPCNGSPAQLLFETPDSLQETNWFGPDQFYSDADTVDVNIAGTYYLLVKGLNGCEKLDSMFVSADPLLPTLDVNVLHINCERDLGLIEISAADIVAFDYVISGTNTLVTSAQSLQISIPDDFIVRAIHRETSCEQRVEVTLIADTLRPSVDIQERDSIVCDHREIRLASQVDTLVEYQWSTIDGHIIGANDGAVIRLDQPGLYHLMVRNEANGCTNLDMIQVSEKINNLRHLAFDIEDADCHGADDARILVTGVVGGTGPYEYSINGQYFSDRPIFDFLAPGAYPLYVRDVNGCLYDTTMQIGRVPLFFVTLDVDQVVVDLGQELDLSVTTDLPDREIYSVEWTGESRTHCDLCLDTTLVPLRNHWLLVSLNSEQGCLVSDSVFIRVRDPGGIFVPNAFTPNSDGVNDVAKVFVGPNIDRIELFEIYDRWGNNMFRAFDYMPDAPIGEWDGRLRNGELTPATYVYVVRARDIVGNTKFRKGSIVLLK